jgi:hypothetical protein
MTSKMTVVELKKLCKQKGIKGYSKLNKAQLIQKCKGSASPKKPSPKKPSPKKPRPKKISKPNNDIYYILAYRNDIFGFFHDPEKIVEVLERLNYLHLKDKMVIGKNTYGNILRNEGDLIYKPVLRFRTIKGKKDVIEDKIYEAIRQLPKLKKTNKKYIMIGYDDNYRLFSDKKSSDDFAKVTKPLSKYMFEVTTGDMNDIIPDDDE